MKIGLIDVDGHNFPNLALMKLSAWHKRQGDHVEWYQPFNGFIEEYDIVYKSKVFSFTPDYEFPIYSKSVVAGGTGYCIETIDGKEIFHKERNHNLPNEVEHIYPDYSLYPDMTKDTAYGFLTRGCPRGCDFCIVKDKEGRCSIKVADLWEFWRDQKNIVLCDPNLIACREWKDLLQQLIDSKSTIEINQGIDIRIMTEEKAEMLKQIKFNMIHFAWDKFEEKDFILPKFKLFKEITNFNERMLKVYCLTNFNTTHEQDLERIYTLRDLGYDPYVMIYNKEQTTSKDTVRRLQRWCNNKYVFRSCEKFEDYKASRNEIQNRNESNATRCTDRQTVCGYVGTIGNKTRQVCRSARRLWRDSD